MGNAESAKLGSTRMSGARVALLGYGPGTREHAMGLRDAKNEVAIGVRLGGRSWLRARADGFQPKQASVVVDQANVVVVLVPDDEQPSLYWHVVQPHLRPDALLVFGRGVALATGAFEPRGVDVVLVTADPSGEHCRVAVHHDATGRALDRAIAYARAAFGPNVSVGTTTIGAEVDAELAALEEHAGGPEELLAHVERTMARVRDSHAPDEAKLRFYERLHEMVAQRATESRPLAIDRRSGASLSGHHRVHKRGVA